MNRIALMIGLAMIGIAAAAVWATSPVGEALKASASSVLAAPPTSGHSLHGTAPKDMPLAKTHDHGFVFPPSDD
jgi:hypothetical protein